MVKRLASASEVNAAMDDPDDIHKASNTAYFFVVFRLAWYFICSVASLVAVIFLAIENTNLLDEFKDNGDLTATAKATADKRLDRMSSLCAFEFFAIPRAQQGGGDDIVCFTGIDVYAGANGRLTRNETEDALIPDDTTELRCHFVTGVLAVSCLYGAIMTVITGLLLFNKKVKVSQSIIIELLMSGALAILCIAMASLVTNRFGSSCSACIAKSDEGGTGPTCEEFAVIVTFSRRAQKADAGHGVADMLPWFKMMSALQDGLWATAIGWTVLTIMLRIRFKNARLTAQSPEFNNTLQNADYGDDDAAPKGAQAPSRAQQASPAPSYATTESVPPPVAEGNPFA